MEQINDHAVGFPHGDVIDVMRFLVEALHEELNRIKVKPPSYEIEYHPFYKENLPVIVGKPFHRFIAYSLPIIKGIFMKEKTQSSLIALVVKCSFARSAFNAERWWMNSTTSMTFHLISERISALIL